MKLKVLSTCFCTNDVPGCKEFYQRHFQAKVTFDCGWYVNLDIGDDGASIQFMSPQGDTAPFGGDGIVLNLQVDDVDAEYARLVEEGLEIVMPLEDHPWGDRGFSVIDPIGINLYIYATREPSEEFKQYYTE